MPSHYAAYNIKPFNPFGAFQDARQSAMKNRLVQQRTDLLQQGENRLRDRFEWERQESERERQGEERLRETRGAAMRATTSESQSAMALLFEESPSDAKALQKLKSNASAQKRAGLKHLGRQFAAFASTMEDVSDDEFAGKYQQAREQFIKYWKVPESAIPGEPNEEWVDGIGLIGLAMMEDEPSERTLSPGQVVMRGDKVVSKHPEDQAPATAAQKANNAEIDAARQRLRDAIGATPAGQTPRDVLQGRITKAGDRGRENKDYDPFLDRDFRAAAQRKVGDDPGFEEFGQWMDQRTPPLPRPKPSREPTAEEDTGFSLGNIGQAIEDKVRSGIGAVGRAAGAMDRAVEVPFLEVPEKPNVEKLTAGQEKIIEYARTAVKDGGSKAEIEKILRERNIPDEWIQWILAGN